MDAYTLRARLQPALLAVLPLAIALTACFPNGVTGWTALSSVIVACGGAYLVAELGRDAGKRKEETLFAIWGGKPTTLHLSHRTAPNKLTLARYHRRLDELIPDVTLPNEEEEINDPLAANEAYEAAVTYLREQTRDRKAFPLVYEALCEYGFRRNLWGLKPVGLTCSLVGFAASAALLIGHYRFGASISVPTMLVAGGLNAGFALFWLAKICPSWVEITGFAYAERLLAAVDKVGARSST